MLVTDCPPPTAPPPSASWLRNCGGRLRTVRAGERALHASRLSSLEILVLRTALLPAGPPAPVAGPVVDVAETAAAARLLDDDSRLFSLSARASMRPCPEGRCRRRALYDGASRKGTVQTQAIGLSKWQTRMKLAPKVVKHIKHIS